MTTKLTLPILLFILSSFTLFGQKPPEKLVTFKGKIFRNQFNVNHSHYLHLFASDPSRQEIWHWNDSSEKLTFLAKVEKPAGKHPAHFINGNNGLYFVCNIVDSQTVLLRLKNDSVIKSFKYPYHSRNFQRNDLGFQFHVKTSKSGKTIFAGGYFDDKLDTMIMLDTPSTIPFCVRTCDDFVLYSRVENDGTIKTYVRPFGTQKDSFLFDGVLSTRTCFKQDGIWYFDIYRDNKDNIWEIGKNWNLKRNITNLAACRQTLITEPTNSGTVIARHHSNGGEECADSALAIYVVRKGKVEALNYYYKQIGFLPYSNMVAVDSNHFFFNGNGAINILLHPTKRQKHLNINPYPFIRHGGLVSDNQGKFFYIKSDRRNADIGETICRYDITDDSTGVLVPEYDEIGLFYKTDQYLYFSTDTLSGTDSFETTLHRILLDRPFVVTTKTVGVHTTHNIELYPNPATNRIQFSEPLEAGSIYNLQGAKVLSFSSGQTQLDVSHVKAGIYLVRMRDGRSARLVIRR